MRLPTLRLICSRQGMGSSWGKKCRSLFWNCVSESTSWALSYRYRTCIRLNRLGKSVLLMFVMCVACHYMLFCVLLVIIPCYVCSMSSLCVISSPSLYSDGKWMLHLSQMVYLHPTTIAMAWWGPVIWQSCIYPTHFFGCSGGLCDLLPRLWRCYFIRIGGQVANWLPVLMLRSCWFSDEDIRSAEPVILSVFESSCSVAVIK